MFVFIIVLQIPVFAQFRMWKAFYVWKKNVRGKKLTDHKKSLNENLFIVNPVSHLNRYIIVDKGFNNK